MRTFKRDLWVGLLVSTGRAAILASVTAACASGPSSASSGASSGAAGGAGSAYSGGTGGTGAGGGTGGTGGGGASGGTGASGSGATTGAASGATTGATSGVGGTSGSAGASGAAGSSGAPEGGASDASGPSNGTDGGAANMGVLSVPTTAVYNGLRGQSFDAGWKFNLGDVSGAQSPTFNDASWRTLDLPHDWSIELAFDQNSPAGSGGGFLDGGVGWYRKTFTLDASASSKRILVDFDGVYMNSQVWINGTSLGTRPYGYSTFEYDLTPYVKFDGTNNVIAVEANNNQPNSRFYSGSGIYRNVWLTELGPVHVPWSGVFVSPVVSGGAATVAVTTSVENLSTASASVVVRTTIAAPDGTAAASNDSPMTTVAASATSTVSQSLAIASPVLWSVASPALYQVTVQVLVGGTAVDTYVTSTGLRTATFDPSTGFSLNGQNMKVRGVNMHHDLGALGTAVNYRAIERQVRVLKSMGVNAIRTAHNPPAPELIDIADRLGVLILEEAFDTWTQTKTANDYGLYFDDWAQRDIQTMVLRDRNHPSIILWSIGNEVGGSTVATAQSLINWVRADDTTRAITWASNKMGGPHVSEGDDRAVAALLDVQGYNYAPYAGDYDADHTANPTWNLMATETSAAVRSRGIYHTPATTVTMSTSQSSPDRQCSSYDNETVSFGATAESAYSYDNDRAFVVGSFVWSGFDYIGEPTPYASWPSKSSYFGAIDTAGFPKDIYYFYKSRWTTDPMVHILPHWNWTSGTTVTVFVYDNCDSVELFLNGASQGSKTMSGTTLHLAWNVPWATGTLRAACTRGGSVVATDQVQTAGAAAGVLLSADRTAIAADGRDLIFVTGQIEDANGVVVPTASNAVTFSVSGPGQLVGVDNGNPIDTASYKGTSRDAFSGKVLAIVRSTGAAGAITVGATASGLTAGSVMVSAGP